MALKVLQLSAIDATIYKFILPLMNGLREEGFEVCFACKDLGYMKDIGTHGYEGFNIKIDRRIDFCSNIKTIIQLYGLLKREKIDIIHVHTPIAAVLGRIAARLAGIKTTIYTVHGLYITNEFFYHVEKFMAKCFTDYIFTVNQEDVDYLERECFFRSDKMLNLNSVGIDTKQFDPEKIGMDERKRLRVELSFKTDDIIIGFVGRIVEEKGVVDLLKAFSAISKKYQNVKLIMVGTWELGERDNGAKAILDEIINKNKLNDRVFFTGQREDIADLLSIVDIFVLPSYREGMPVSLLEAMSMGLPVIATDIRGCRDEVTEDTGLLYKPGDIKALEKAIVFFIEDREKALLFGKNARARVIEHFKQEDRVSKQIEVYKMLSSVYHSQDVKEH